MSKGDQQLCDCPACLAAREKRRAVKAYRPTLDPALWVIRRKFGVAGGPDQVELTKEGLARAFSMGARVKMGPASRALEALWDAGSEGPLSERRPGSSRLFPTALGKHSGLAWTHLRALGYVEPPGGDDSVRLTALGRSTVRNGLAERDFLLQRCQQIAKEEELIS